MKADIATHLKGIFAIYSRWRSWQRIVYLFVTTALIGLMIVQTEIADAVNRGELDLTWQPWIWTYSAVYSYTIIAPFLIYCCEQWPFGRTYVLKTTFNLFVLYIPITFMFITVMLGLRHIAYLLIDGTLFPIHSLIDRYVYEYPKALGVYIGFVFITYTKIYYDSAKKEQLNAARLENEMQAIRMQTLRSQLQPHFLFNTLNLISSTVYQDAEKADSLITRLGDLLRYSLATEQKPFVRFEEEVAAMTSYLDISELRFGDRMSTSINIAEDTRSLMIPAMLLQPLLENAVKYGIEPSQQSGEVSLRSCLDKDQLVIEITNPWHQLRQEQESFGIGLKNCKSRLQLLYSDNASVDLTHNDSGLVSVIITLPAQRVLT